MNYTTNYNLKKPEGTDFYNVADFNDNADILDAMLAGKADTADLGDKVDKIVGKGLSTNDYDATDKAKVDKLIFNGTLIDASILPEDIEMSQTSLTIAAASWNNNTVTVTTSGVTSDCAVVVCPSPASMDNYSGARMKCTAQATNSLTFTCDTAPTEAVTVNVLILKWR